MKTDRRTFIRNAGLIALAGFTGVENLFAISGYKVFPSSKKGLSLSFIPYELQLQHMFTLAKQFEENNT